MQRRYCRDLSISHRHLAPLAPEPRDAFGNSEYFFGSRSTGSNNDFRSDEFDLPLEKRTAGERLLWCRRAVTRWAPVDDVGDVNVRLGETDRCKHLIEQLARPANEGLALEIFVPPGRLANDHQRRLRRPAIKAELRGRRFKAATIEIPKSGFQRFERGGLPRDPPGPGFCVAWP